MIKLIKSTFYQERETKDKLTNFIGRTSQLSFGPECEKFEKNFAEYQGRKYCIFFNSGSSANLALIQALLNSGQLKPGNEVGFSALTWATNVMPLIQLGLRPVPIDIELDTLNISSKKVTESLKNKGLKALFITNLLGFCHDIDQIKKICQDQNMILIEDNCEALCTVYKGKKLGNFGLASTFSFFVGHHMSTIEGGAVCTDDKDLAKMLRIVRAHGWNRHLEEEEKEELRAKHRVKQFHAQYTFYDLGYNLRPTEINGFLGNEQLRHIDKIIQKRNQNFTQLAKTIYANRAFIPLRHSHIDMVSNFAFPVLCRSQGDHDRLVKKLKNKLEIRPIVGGSMILQPFFKKHNRDQTETSSCPNAEFRSE